MFERTGAPERCTDTFRTLRIVSDLVSPAKRPPLRLPLTNGWLNQLRLDEGRNQSYGEDQNHTTNKHQWNEVSGMHVDHFVSTHRKPSATEARLQVVEVLVHQGQVVVAGVHRSHFHRVEVLD